jgi:hypothetical protein
MARRHTYHTSPTIGEENSRFQEERTISPTRSRFQHAGQRVVNAPLTPSDWHGEQHGSSPHGGVEVAPLHFGALVSFTALTEAGEHDGWLRAGAFILVTGCRLS